MSALTEKLIGRRLPISVMIRGEIGQFSKATGLHPNVLVIHPDMFAELREDMEMGLMLMDCFEKNRNFMGMRVYISTDVPDFDLSFSAQK